MGKKQAVSRYQHHAITAAISAIVPALLPSGPGLSLVPGMFLAGARIRGLHIRFWGVLPLAALVAALEGVESVLGTVFPLGLVVALHYYMVSKAAVWRSSQREALDTFADGVSGFLNQKCYVEKVWPKFLHMKSERVLISFSCILKIALAIAWLVLFMLFQGFPSDPLDCAGTTPRGLKVWTWIMFGCVALTEILYHCAMYLSNNIRCAVVNSFALPVLQPTYWQWYIVAQYGPTHGIWVPLFVENVRTISVSFFRMQDKDDHFISPLVSSIDVLHVIAVILSRPFGCVYPAAVLYRQLLAGALFVQSVSTLRLKKWRTWSPAKKKACPRIRL
jgi:hypothetical protein